MRQPPVDYIQRTRDQYAALGYGAYRWVHNSEPPPFVIPKKPMSEWRVGLVASGGIYAEGQIAFHHKDDTSYREIATDIEIENLRATHFAYDLTDARRDPNVVFPISRLREMVDEGVLGSINAHAYTFMGGIYSSRKVRDELAPSITRELKAEHVDIALLVPV